MRLSILLILVLGNFLQGYAQFTVKFDELRTSLDARNIYIERPKGTPHVTYFHKVSPWEDWVLELRKFSKARTGGADKVELRIFPVKDTSSVHFLTAIYPKIRDNFFVSIDMGGSSGYVSPWSIYQDEVRFIVRDATINTLEPDRVQFFFH